MSYLGLGLIVEVSASMFDKKHGQIILGIHATQSIQFLPPALLQAYIMTLRTSFSLYMHAHSLSCDGFEAAL